MDIDHRDRYRAWSRADILRLNVFVVATVGGIYAVNRFWLRHVTSNWFVHGYLNDISAGTMVLAYANLVIGITPFFTRIIVSPPQIAAFIFVAGLYWEFVTPLYRSYTADPVDLAAYVVGGALYYAVIAARQRTRTAKLKQRRKNTHEPNKYYPATWRGSAWSGNL